MAIRPVRWPCDCIYWKTQNNSLTHLPLDKMAAILANDNFKCIFNANDRIPIHIFFHREESEAGWYLFTHTALCIYISMSLNYLIQYKLGCHIGHVSYSVFG